ncbi:MAG: glycosyltransferase family 4 protein [Oscillospiraceae bacterium]|nr:glycosyltransferase family 4 protein [Oscillospiraceae bacterium]
MNILFVSISSMPDMESHSISLDLLHQLRDKGHRVYVVCAVERRENGETACSQEAGFTVLRVKTGNNKKANLIEKGITTVLLPHIYKSAIKKYFSDVKFDLVLYPTPPITHCDTVKFIKKRDGANSYLVLKDIFPQNAVDIGMMTKSGVKGILYRHFRRKEKKLYALSDRIGCMSQANVDYVLRHNPEVDPAKVEICPNAIEIRDMSVNPEVRAELRDKYNIPRDKKVFVYGGNLGRPQGIPFVIECLKKQKDNPDVFFLLVGDGTEFKKLEAFLQAEQPKNALLLKRLPKEDYDRLVAACDVGLIFLDHRFTIPNFPSRLLGYLQAKLPVLACTDPNTDVGKVITEGGFGWWCESDDTDAFGAQLDAAVAADLPAMGERGFAYLNEHYAVERAYQTIMNGR